MRSRVWQGSSIVVLSWLLLACSSSKTAAPVQGLGNDRLVSTVPTRQGTAQPAIQGNSYTVKKGDTLYSIAFNSGNDVPSLASLNGISPPYNIYPGQQIRFDAGQAPECAGQLRFVRWQPAGCTHCRHLSGSPWGYSEQHRPSVWHVESDAGTE